VLFHYFDRFLAEYESRFQKEYGFFRPVIKDVVERYLDCGNPRCGSARHEQFPTAFDIFSFVIYICSGWLKG
jgi:hypothetical protein